jgi:sugar/nucleoside kinase (ribokinase family)
MGAGDAFLSVVSPFAAAGVSMKDLLRIGNAAGAIKVGIVGHRKSVDRETLRAYLNG